MEDFVKSTQKDMYQQELGNYTNRWRQNCKLKSVLGKKWNQMNLLYIYVTQKNFFKRV